MDAAGANVEMTSEQVAAQVQRYWGFTELRPLQMEAILAGASQRDSLVVMPTGGGKSLCYQVPPLLDEGTDVVVSPLISLMKDQVDGLRANGYPAAALHSGMSPAERREVETKLSQGEYRLLFVAPERLITSWFLETARRIGVKRFAIDEAHCISQWGHDFRPEYRQLAFLKDRFRGASVHAFTATATPRVREDIVAQLGLRDPSVLVGCFDRPNLTYRIVQQVDRYRQIVEVIRRRAGEAAIVYCISRKDTESTAATLKANGIRAAFYHAGMDADERRKTQERFTDEELDVVVATVAFGMGIDRSNVRCVIHAAMPKTIESYQQETGRAGRDGLAAECVMLYSPADVIRWESLIRMSAENAPAEDRPAIVQTQTALLRTMQKFASAMQCRHRALSEYFGQEYGRENCGACDVCLGDSEGVPDSTVIAQKILSCVARTEQRFGLGHVVDVLLGGNTEMVRRCEHEKLSTYGLLKDMGKKELMSMVYQLLDQGLLGRTEGDRPVLRLNEASLLVMRGKQQVRLLQPKAKGPRKSAGEANSWDGVDRPLFESLRQWRRRVAAARKLPPYVVFDDATLMELSRVRPTRLEALRHVKGIGEKRMADFGQIIVFEIAEFCRRHEITTDLIDAAEITIVSVRKTSASKEDAARLFDEGKSIDAVAKAMGRATGTVLKYLTEYIGEKRPDSIETWVSADLYQRVEGAAENSEDGRIAAIYAKLNAEVPYETIHLVMAHLKTKA
jgi:ATP-dependent DNA helicase RecQ